MTLFPDLPKLGGNTLGDLFRRFYASASVGGNFGRISLLTVGAMWLAIRIFQEREYLT